MPLPLYTQQIKKDNNIEIIKNDNIEIIKKLNIFDIQLTEFDIVKKDIKEFKLSNIQKNGLDLFIDIIDNLINPINLKTKNYSNLELKEVIWSTIITFIKNNNLSNNYNYIISNYKLLSFLNQKNKWSLFHNMKYNIQFIINNSVDYIIFGSKPKLSPILYFLNPNSKKHFFYIKEDMNNYFKVIKIIENRIDDIEVSNIQILKQSKLENDILEQFKSSSKNLAISGETSFVKENTHNIIIDPTKLKIESLNKFLLTIIKITKILSYETDVIFISNIKILYFLNKYYLHLKKQNFKNNNNKSFIYGKKDNITYILDIQVDDNVIILKRNNKMSKINVIDKNKYLL